MSRRPLGPYGKLMTAVPPADSKLKMGAPLPSDLRARSAALGYLYAAGALLVVVSLLLPSSMPKNETGLVAVTTSALVVAALFLGFRRRPLPSWLYQVALAIGTGHICLVIYYSHTGTSPFGLFFMFVTVYACYFFTYRQAAVQLALVGSAYAATLMAVEDTVDPLTRWIITMGTVLVVGALVARLATRVRAQAAEMTAIAAVARDLAAITSAHAARPAICTAALELAEGKVAIMYEPDPKGRELTSTAVVGPHLGEPIHLPFAGAPSGAGTAFASGQPFFVADLNDHAAVAPRLVDQLGVASALWQPMLRNGVPVGVLTVAWAERVAELSPRVEALMSLLATEAAVAVERTDMLARLEKVARTDDLTGLANRRALDEQLERELARAEREEKPLCVAMLDLDRFKDFNDEQGHQAGDRLLKQVTSAWRAQLRPSDVLARYGGEEFVLLLPVCPLERGRRVVERLHQEMILDQTCSGGIAQWNGEETGEALLARADDALYEAKRLGRDRVVAATF